MLLTASDSEENEDNHKENLYNLREHQNHHKEAVDRNTYVNIAAGEVWEGNEEHVIENCRKDHSC